MKLQPEFPRPGRLGTVRILLLEDDAVFAGLVRDSLRRAASDALEIEHVTTLGEALRRLGARAFDLILTDLSVPDSHGLDTLASLAAASDRLICVVTGERDAGLREAALALGAYDLLSKDQLPAEELDRLVRLAVMQARALGSVRRSEARLRAIVEAEPECVKLIDEECRLIEMNPAGLRMVEADSLEPLRGECLLGLVSDEHREAFAAMARRVAGGRPATLEFEIRGLRGTPRWLETHAVPLREEGAERALVLSITRDVTERRRAQEERAGFERIARALAAANEAILKAQNEVELFDRACEIGVSVGEFLLAAVLRLQPDGWLTRVVAKGSDASQSPQSPSIDPDRPEGRGLAGQACRTRKPVISNDFATDPRVGVFRERLAGKVGSVAVFPLLAEGNVAGVFVLRHARANAFTDELASLLGRVADNISLALTNFRRLAERSRAEQVRQLEHAVTGALAGAASLQSGVEAVLRTVCEAHDWATGRLWRADERAGVLRFLGTWSPSPAEMARSAEGSRNLVFRRGEGLAGRVWESGEPLWVSDTSDDRRIIRPRLPRGAEPRGVFLFPVTADGKVIGVASFSSPSVREPDTRLLQAVQVIGAQLGLFLQRQDAERVLRESEARFRSLTELSSDWYWEQDAELRFVSVTGRARGVDASRVEQLIGKRRWEAGYVGLTEAQWAAHRADVEARRPFRDLEYARPMADGTLLWMSVTGEPLFDEQGIFRGYRGVGADITDRKREERLRNLEHSIARELTSAQPASSVLAAVLRALCEQGGFDCARYFELDDSDAAMRFRDGYAVDAEMARFVEGSRELRFAPGSGLVGLVWQTGEALWSADAANDPRVQATALARSIGVHGTLVVPVSFEGRVIGVLSASTRRASGPEARLVETLRVAGAQIGQYLERKQREATLDRFRTALDRSADMVLLVDLQRDGGTFLDFNETACYCLGYERHELLGRPAGMIVADLELDALRASQRALLERPGRTDLVVRMYRRKDGSTFEVEVLRKIVDSSHGPILLLNARDLTERRRIEERQAAHLRYQESTARFGQAALGRRDSLELVEDALETLKEGLGCEAGYKDRLPANWRAGYPSALSEPVGGEHGDQGVLYALSQRENAFGPEEARFLAATASILSAGLSRIDSEQRLAFLAQFDALTGLPNRALLRDRFAQLIAQARRRGGALGMLFIDLDDFKLVNDTMGHAAGDELLKAVAQRLHGGVRPGDTVARIAGDEFAVILGDLARPEDAALVAQKIIDRLAEPLVISGQEVFVSASLGIALYPADGEDAEALLAAADAAMYRAKQAGRNSFQFFTADINQRSRARAQLAVELRRALERGEFEVFYQPKYDLRAGRPCAAEALLRWRHPERGTVGPAEFIPVLEETGLIVAVGEWVLRQACADVRARREASLPALPVAVNLSARQFRQQDLHSRILHAVREAAIDPALLELEITESQLMHDPDHAQRVLRSLSAAGIRVAIDDFGTGYSSLAYLTRFPVHALKIDRSFVADVLDDHADAAIVRAIIDMAHTLGFIVVAEGVETQAQATLLRGLGCEQAQGYFFSAALPEADFRALIARAL